MIYVAFEDLEALAEIFCPALGLPLKARIDGLVPTGKKED
jgi:hypothetical protein